MREKMEKVADEILEQQDRYFQLEIRKERGQPRWDLILVENDPDSMERGEETVVGEMTERETGGSGLGWVPRGVGYTVREAKLFDTELTTGRELYVTNFRKQELIEDAIQPLMKPGNKLLGGTVYRPRRGRR